MSPLLAAAEAGQIILFWSPTIIAEASRVLLWIWLHQRGGSMTESLKRESFDIARRWLQRMSSVFYVVEDRPPHEPLWTDTPRDEDDRPIWNAAVRAGALVVVTDNLKDGPPDDDDGFQVWNDVMYMHPAEMAETLDRLGQFFETSQQSAAERAEPTRSIDDMVHSEALSPTILHFLRMVEWRARTELPPDET